MFLKCRRLVLTILALAFFGAVSAVCTNVGLARESKAVLAARTEALRALLSSLDDLSGMGVAPDLEKRYQDFKMQMSTYQGDQAAPLEEMAMRKLLQQLSNKADPVQVATLAQQIHRRLVKAFNLVTAPAQTPSLNLAASIFSQQCARCHGSLGRGDGPLADKIKPPLKNLADPKVMRHTTPFRFYDRIALGVADTAMPAFRGQLTQHELWSLAYYVAALPYLSNDKPVSDIWRSFASDQERSQLTKAGLDLSRLSLDSDAALDSWLEASLPQTTTPRRQALLQGLRAMAPFSGDLPRGKAP